MPGDSREDFEAAIAELSQEGGGGGNTNSTGGAEDFRDQRQEQLSGDNDKDTFDAATGKPVGEGRQRDANGRYAPKVEATDPVPADQQQGQQKPVANAPAPKPGESRPPVSWKPEEREGWEQMAPHHKAAVARRELEVQQILSTTAEARRFHNEFSQMVQPYLGMIQAENSDPVRAANYLFQTAAQLRTAPPGVKANLVADLVMQYGISPEMLDSALAARIQGRPAPSNPMDQIFQALDQRLRPVTEFMNGMQSQNQVLEQQRMSTAQQTWEAFVADPANEFAQDLAEDMADLLETAAKRGRALSLQDAYRAATLAHPTISKIVQSRTQASGVAQQTAAARRAAAAAASLPSNGGAPSQENGQDDGGDSIRGALASSIRTLNQRRN